MRHGRKSRLLILTTTSDIGGMPRITTGLARGLAAQGWLVQYVFPQWPHDDATAWYQSQGITAGMSTIAPDYWLRREVRDLLALRRFIRQRRPDVVNVHYGDNSISLKDVLAIRLAGRHRCVVSVHHPTPLPGVPTNRPGMTALAARFADRVVVFSEATRDALLHAGAPAHKIHVIPCGLSVPTRFPDRGEARARLGLPADAYVVGSLARLVQEKGIADLIEAAAHVPDPGQKLRLVVVGDGPERVSLERLAASRLGPRAIFPGRVSDTADFYAALDVFALPSSMEGFGLVYIEAAFHSVPSIGTTAGGIPDAIIDGETGILLAPGDVAALARVLQQLRDAPSLRLRLGQAARSRAYRELTETRMAERFADVFKP